MKKDIEIPRNGKICLDDIINSLVKRIKLKTHEEKSNFDKTKHPMHPYNESTIYLLQND